MRMPEMGKSLAKRWLGQSQKEEAAKKNLLIFLDDQEKKEIYFTGGLLATALEQEASLIIVSTSLLNHIMDKETMWPGYDDLNDQSYLVQDIKVFRPDRWIVKKVNDFLSLLIPVNYLEFLNIDKNKVKELLNLLLLHFSF